MEAAFPGSSAVKPKFALSLIELEPRVTTTLDGVSVRPFRVNHGNPGGPYFAYRLETEGRSIAYTGDTEWTDELVEAGAGGGGASSPPPSWLSSTQNVAPSSDRMP